MNKLFITIFLAFSLGTIPVLANTPARANTPQQDNSPQSTEDETFQLPTDIYLDSIADAPILITWFDEPRKLTFSNDNTLSISPVEYTNLYTKEKLYCLYFNTNFYSTWTNTRGNINFPIQGQEIATIIRPIRQMLSYTSKSLSSNKENIVFAKDLSIDLGLQIQLNYDPDGYKWTGKIEFISKSSYVSKSPKYKLIPNEGFSISGNFKNALEDLPRLIDYILESMAAIEARKQMAHNDLITENQEDGSILYYFKHKNPSFEEFPVTGFEYIDRLYSYNFSSLNNNINKTICDEIKTFDIDEQYGVVDLIINSNGQINNAVLSIFPEASNRIDIRTIKLIFNQINTFYIKEKTPGLKYPLDKIRITIPISAK